MDEELTKPRSRTKDFLKDLYDLKVPLAFAAGGAALDRYTTWLGFEKLREWG